jgi:glucose-1-phosphate adenylyltransferase
MGDRIVVLAGGISSRMKRPQYDLNKIDERLKNEADKKSKSMIGVGKNYRPFLDYLLYNVREAGYEDIVIVIGEKDLSIKEQYGEKDRDNQFYGMKISYATQMIPEGRTKPLGTADALLQALRCRTDWRGEKYTVCNSDNLYSVEALKQLSDTPYDNAFIEYDRAALNFPQERIEGFAVTKKDEENFLVDIIEKPSPQEIEGVKTKDGKIGVSMNLFRLNYDMIFPYLEIVPIDEKRGEKELPNAVRMMINDHSQSMYAYWISEHVPDLTYKNDISNVQKYIEKGYEDNIFE